MIKVGKSSRTPFKHWLLDHHLGQIVGVLKNCNPKVPAKANPFLCVDLCAGDGVCQGRIGQECSECLGNNCCSPRLIVKHCRWLREKGFPVRMQFYEKSHYTCDSLLKHIQEFAADMNGLWEVRAKDAKEFRLRFRSKNQAVFVNCDPNHIEDMPLVGELVDSLTPTTTLIVTLGCNVGGLKRLNWEKRQKWFDYVNVLIDAMPVWHDAILTELVGDHSQWAYFSRVPLVWVGDHLRTIKRKGNKMFPPKGVNSINYRSDSGKFRRMVNRLFLTRKELE